MKANFKHYGSIAVAPFLSALEGIKPQDWSKYTYRQDLFPMHSKTQTIPILYDTDYEVGVSKKSSFYDLFKNSIEYTTKTISELTNSNCSILRFIITNLPANTIVDKHKDKANSFKLYNRVHIPIITNNNVLFTVGEETINMPAGEIYEINNNNQLHGVVNNGNEDRLHIILDWYDYTKRTAI
jgi:hypothetical protein